MQPILDWLTSLPPATLYLVLGLAAAVENIFPPFPADTVFVRASRGEFDAVVDDCGFSGDTTDDEEKGLPGRRDTPTAAPTGHAQGGGYP